MHSKELARQEYMESGCEIGLFSGRFDPPTAGHLICVSTLLMKYAKIIVVILDYKGREGCTANKAKDLWDYYFDLILPPIARNKVAIVINDIHFGKITREQLNEFVEKNNLKFDVYLSGNIEVLKHIDSLGYSARYIPRVSFPLDYSVYAATDVRRIMKSMDMSMEDYYRLETPK